MAIVAKIYLIRHGETDANRNKIIQGHLDTPLNNTGLKQAISVASALRRVKFDLALSSDLQRTETTALMILEHQPSLELRKVKELRERFMGELQGQVYGSHKLPIGESTIEMEHALRARALTWWREAIVGHTASLLPQEEPYNILVVSHGGFISTLVRSLTQSRQVTSEKVVLVPSLPNVSMSVIEWDGEVWRLVKYGDASHLSADEEALDHNVDEIRI